MVNKPTAKLLKKPASMSCQVIPWSAGRDVLSSKPPARTTIGIDNRKENRAASSRFKPKSIPPEIVDPEREIPGSRAKD